MDALLNKLNFKTPKSVLIVNAPDEVKPMVDSIKQYAEVSVTVGDHDPVDFVICFVTRKAEIAPLVNLIIPKLNEDAVFSISTVTMVGRRWGSSKWNLYGRSLSMMTGVHCDFGV